MDRSRVTNRIHEVDLVRAIDRLLFSPNPPRLLHGVDGRAVKQGEVVDYIAARIGVEPPPGTEDVEPTGRNLDGSTLKKLLGSLEYPDYVSGYASVFDDTV